MPASSLSDDRPAVAALDDRRAPQLVAPPQRPPHRVARRARHRSTATRSSSAGERFDGRRVVRIRPANDRMPPPSRPEIGRRPDADELQLTLGHAALERPEHRPDILLGATLAAVAARRRGERRPACVRRGARCGPAERARRWLPPAASCRGHRAPRDRRGAGHGVPTRWSAVHEPGRTARRSCGPGGHLRATPIADGVSLVDQRVERGDRAEHVQDHLLLVQVQLREPPQRILTVGEAAAQRRSDRRASAADL